MPRGLFVPVMMTTLPTQRGEAESPATVGMVGMFSKVESGRGGWRRCSLRAARRRFGAAVIVWEALGRGDSGDGWDGRREGAELEEGRSVVEERLYNEVRGGEPGAPRLEFPGYRAKLD